jgi:hypothetical protein
MMWRPGTAISSPTTDPLAARNMARKAPAARRNGAADVAAVEDGETIAGSRSDPSRKTIFLPRNWIRSRRQKYPPNFPRKADRRHTLTKTNDPESRAADAGAADEAEAGGMTDLVNLSSESIIGGRTAQGQFRLRMTSWTSTLKGLPLLTIL